MTDPATDSAAERGSVSEPLSGNATYKASTHTLCRACGDIFTHKPWDWRDASINHALDKHPADVPDVVFVNLDSAGWLLGDHRD